MTSTLCLLPSNLQLFQPQSNPTSDGEWDVATGSSMGFAAPHPSHLHGLNATMAGVSERLPCQPWERLTSSPKNPSLYFHLVFLSLVQHGGQLLSSSYRHVHKMGVPYQTPIQLPGLSDNQSPAIPADMLLLPENLQNTNSNQMTETTGCI